MEEKLQAIIEEATNRFLVPNLIGEGKDTSIHSGAVAIAFEYIKQEFCKIATQ